MGQPNIAFLKNIVIRKTIVYSSTIIKMLSWWKYSFWTPIKGSNKIGSVCLSFHLSGNFLGILWLVFLNFGMGLKSHEKLCITEPNFLGKQSPKWAKNRVNLLENLVIKFYRIWSIVKIYIIWYVPAQIPYLGKFLFLRYRPKCSQPIRL